MMRPQRLPQPQVRGTIYVDNFSVENVVGGIVGAQVQGLQTSDANHVVFLSPGNPQTGDVLRTSSSSQADWKSINNLHPDDLPETAVQPGTYSLPIIDVDTKGRITRAVETYHPHQPLFLQKGSSSVHIIKQKNTWAQVGPDTVQIMLDLDVSLSDGNDTLHLNNLPRKVNTNIISHFSNLIMVNNQPAVVEVHYPNTLIIKITQQKEKNLHLKGNFVYQI